MARSTFFYHQKRLTAPDKHAELKDAIRDSFQRNKHRYGYRRVLLDLRNQGWVVNHKLVYKLMRAMGLKAKIRQRRPYISYTGTISYIAENTLERNFTPIGSTLSSSATSPSSKSLAARCIFHR